MTNHPRQREMWDGLTRSGCLTVLGIIILSTIIGIILL
jgi:hypothetical protein